MWSMVSRPGMQCGEFSVAKVSWRSTTAALIAVRPATLPPRTHGPAWRDSNPRPDQGTDRQGAGELIQGPSCLLIGCALSPRHGSAGSPREGMLLHHVKPSPKAAALAGCGSGLGWNGVRE